MPYKILTWSVRIPAPTPYLDTFMGPFRGRVWIDWIQGITTYAGPAQRPSLEIAFTKRNDAHDISESPDVHYPREHQVVDPSTTSEITTEQDTKLPVCRSAPWENTYLRFSYEGAGVPANDFTAHVRIWTD